MKKIALALGSGGSRGLAHIGVIKTLETHHMPIDMIAGSSIGAMIGGFYAATSDIKLIEKLVLDNTWKNVLKLIADPSIRGGLIQGEKIKTFIENVVGKITFADLKIPLSVITTNLETGQTVVIDRGDLATAIRASISVPLVFQPIEYQGQLLTDGGLSMPVPVTKASEMGADIVIAVNLDGNFFAEKNQRPKRLYQIAHQSLNIVRYHLARYETNQADIVVIPDIDEAGIIGWRHFLKPDNFIRAGEEAMKGKMAELKKMLNR